ncbi:MAG TPA: FimV/HubP family polar landmark protein [Steroidobacteraceae bacterium]|nr:FimV/HubP family polar landmark protein [Steroidobacteraceae bacterium]
MALSLPGAAHALGLGEIHVNSALNEPLAAEIDILGATAEELSSLTASIANRDTFLRFGAVRPAFLASATFKVSHDLKGSPVLVIRSTDSFTEPVVNLLVDLRWHNGEVIRQYSLLLDPAGFPAATQVAAAVRSPIVPLATPALPAPAAAVTNTLAAAATPIASPDVTASPAASTTRATTHVKIGAKATLRGVAWRVGARSDSDLKKTMLAIFRANPKAFEGNINRLRLGAVLTIPSAADISTISQEDASREIHAQMTAWRSAPHRARAAAAHVQATPAQVQAMPAQVQAMPAPVQAMTGTAPAADAIKASGDAAEAAALNLRVQSLEQGLHDIQGQLERENGKLLSLQAQVRYAEEAVSLPVAAAPAPRHWLVPSLIGGLGLLAGAFGAMLLKLRRRAMPKISADSTLAVSAPMVDETSEPATNDVLAEEPVPRETLRTMPRPLWQDSVELSAVRKIVRDEQEAKAGEQISAAMNTVVAAPPTPAATVSEDELRAAFEDTLDLSGETAILAAEIAAASGDTANTRAATGSLNSRALQAEAVAAAAADDAVTVMVSAEALRVDTTNLDYNLMDLDLTALHVQMPSVLHERVVAKERRTNLVDVLKKAVEREPDRPDLRMKLLETYYAAAAANRQAFLEVVQKLARDRDRLGEGEWDKIAFMGKQIASDTALFSPDSDSEAEDDKLADCA